MAMVYFNRTKQIGSVTIKYSNLNSGFVNNVESIIKETAMQSKIDLKKPNNNENVVIYIYSLEMKREFMRLFGEELYKREKHGANAQMNIVMADDGSIHILMGGGLGTAYLTKLVVAKILEEFIDSKRISTVGKTIKTIIDNRDKKEEEPEEEIDEELEEEIEENIEDEPEEELEEEIENEPEEELEGKIEEIIEEKEVNIPDWLADGWYKYKIGYMTESRSEDLGEYLQTHKVGKVEKMTGKSSMIKEYDREYELKCTKVEYIIYTYGIRRLLKFFRNPDFKEVFRISKRQFDNDWKQYLKEKYVGKVMQDIQKKKDIENKKESKQNIDRAQQSQSKVIQ